jgi:hypothetical protein
MAQINRLRSLAPPTGGPIADAINRKADELTAYANQQRDAAMAQVDALETKTLNEAELNREAFSRDFRNTYAAKIDFKTTEKYASLITSYQQSDSTMHENFRRLKLGGFAGWTVNDAVLLHTEASASLRGKELYPVDDSESPFDLRLSPVREEEDDFRAVALAGGSYTFIGGQTLVLEYLYNGLGYNDGQADEYYDLRAQAADSIDADQPLATLSMITLGEADDPGMKFIRRHYVLLQYQELPVASDFGFILRTALNLDDGSMQLIPILQYNLADRWQIFAIGTKSFGPDKSEFTSLLDYSLRVGVELSL